MYNLKVEDKYVNRIKKCEFIFEIYIFHKSYTSFYPPLNKCSRRQGMNEKDYRGMKEGLGEMQRTERTRVEIYHFTRDK